MSSISALGPSNPILKGVVVDELLSRVWLFAAPWTAAHQAFLSFTLSQSFLKLMSTESSWWCQVHLWDLGRILTM